ncbi:MAG: amino acid permease [Chlamydiae bacterium]|nr:amino acid permease [Chlamydiota bacterium]
MKRPGSLWGGILLIAGSCIGAGMLGLPIITGIAGFFPSMLMFFFAWGFMTLTGLLMAEVNSWFPHQVNMLSMIEKTLGKGGKALCWVTYLFLFYALLVAYISGSGNLFSTFLSGGFGVQIPIWAGSLFFVIFFGGLVLLGTHKVDLWNRVLMGCKILFFLSLIWLGVKYIRPTFLLRTNPSTALFALPILITSFGFHNMIPSLFTYMNRDLKKIRLTIIAGSCFAFLVYIIWEILVLGIVPIGGAGGLIESFKQDREGSQALAMVVRSPWLSFFSQGLAFFAILTSFLTQSLSLVHFLADGFKVKKEKKESISLCLLALIPPLLLSLIYPQLFFKALNFAGGICAVILFGILPILMVWVGRYRKELFSPYEIRGGRWFLVFVACFALFIFFFQISVMVGWTSLPG